MQHFNSWNSGYIIFLREIFVFAAQIAYIQDHHKVSCLTDELLLYLVDSGHSENLRADITESSYTERVCFRMISFKFVLFAHF